MNAYAEFRQAASVETEAAIIGAMLLDSRLIEQAADRLTEEDFSEQFYGHVFGLLVKQHGQGMSANAFSLRPLLSDDGFKALVTLSGTAAAGAGIMGFKGHCEQVSDLAKRRRLSDALTDVMAEASACERPLADIVEAADAALVGALGSGDGTASMTAAQCIGEALEAMAEGDKGVRCHSIPTLDKLLGPIKPKQLVIEAARPGMGKTAAALSYAVGAARAGHGVLFVSLEMSAEELGARMAADMTFDGKTGVPYRALANADATTAQQRRIADVALEADSLPLVIEDLPTVTIGRLNMLVRRHARRMAGRGQKLEMVIVDYLQLVRPDHREASPYAAISEVSRGLKQIAKANAVGVMALAQLSRECEKRPDKRPQLSDLRDSGQIEQDADAVIFLYREEYYLRQSEPAQNDPKRYEWEGALSACEGEIEFICAKRRNGVAGKASASFFGAYQAVRG